jgi:group I intron endonuclease
MKKKGSPGVYIIQNKVNNKVYIGASKDTYNRLCMHKWRLRVDTHDNVHLQSAFNKYGEENFIFDVLEDCDEKLIYSQENYWCKMLNAHDRKYGYNVDPTAPDGKRAVSDETKVKMSASASKRTVRVHTIYGDFYKDFPDMYKCAEEFKTVAPNVHRKMNNINPKKTLIDSKSSMYLFSDIDVSLNDVKAYWDDVFLKLSECEGPYKIYTCFGTFVGTVTSKDIVTILKVRQNAVSTAVRRGTYLKALKIIK